MRYRTAKLILCLMLAWLSLVPEAMGEIANRQYYADVRLFSVIPAKGIDSYRSNGSGGAGGPNAVLGLFVADDGRRFDVEIETKLKSGRFLATVTVQPQKPDEKTKPVNQRFDLTDLQPRLVEIAKEEDGRVYQVQLLPMVKEFPAPKDFAVEDLRLDFWSFRSCPVIVNDQDYAGTLGMSSGQFATIELSGLAKVEFSLKPFRGAKPTGSLKDGTIGLQRDDGTSIKITGVTNGVHHQTLVGGPYQVFSRWSEPSLTIEEHKKQLSETIAIVKKQIEAGDLPANANWVQRLEAAQESDRMMIASSNLGPIPKADRLPKAD